MSPPTAEIFLNYVCPGLGAIMASVMFAAPVGDLKKALVRGSLGDLNALPWVFMSGNCLGWVAYGYYIHDPFVLAGNMPGLVVSLWLNIGAIKVQYYERLVEAKDKPASIMAASSPSQQEEEKWDGDVANNDDAPQDELDLAPPPPQEQQDDNGNLLIASPHERSFLRMIIAWAVVLVWVGWILPPPHPEQIVGIVVNVNLVFFYGAPLQTIWQVMRTLSSESIHRPSMIMNWTNTSFWLAYAVAQRNYVIGIPNALGLLLGIAQGILCLFYPRRTSVHGMEPIPLEEPLTIDNPVLMEDGQAPIEDDANAEISKGDVEIRHRRDGAGQQTDWNVL